MRVTRLLLVAPVVLLSRCVCDEVLTGPPSPEVGLLDAQDNLHTDADPWLIINAGDADSGQTSNAVLRIKNIGTGRLSINEMCFVTASDYQTATSPLTPCFTGTVPFSFSTAVGTELGADELVDVSITFRPTTGGPATVFLRIASNGTAEPFAAAQITGRGTDGALCADPGVLDFGDVSVGSDKTLPVRVFNCGVKPITVDTASLTPNPNSVFSATLAAPYASLEANQGIDLNVTFAPADPIPYRDANRGGIRLTTAAPFDAQYDLILVGNGREPPSCRINVVPTAINFGSVASNTTQTRQLIIQSVGQCACTVQAVTNPTPDNVGFALPSPPAMPLVLRGTTGCADDPSDAASAQSSISIPVSYTSPDRQNPVVDNATLDVTTTAAVDPTRTINLQANGGGSPFCQLDVTPRASGSGFSQLTAQGRHGVVEFGRTAVHIDKRLPITATNVGNADCTISQVAYDRQQNTVANQFSIEDEFGNSGLSNTPIVLAPGQAKTWFAVFAPTRTIESSNPFDVFSFGSYSGSISSNLCGLISPNTRCNGVAIVTNDTVTDMSDSSEVAGRFSIGFSGTPVEPSVDIIPPELDFGLVTLGCGSPERRTTIYNTGATDLVVGQPGIDPATNPATFVVTATSNPGDSPNDSTSGWPFTIAPGNSLSVAVRYIAQTTSLETALLVIPTFEGNPLQEGPPVTVPLRGTGTVDRQQTDIFDQPTDPTVDVLFVVDDSGSMDIVQQQVADNFSEFFTASNVSAADFHIAVTTTLTVDSSCIPDLSGNNTCADHSMSGHYTACGSNDRYLSRTSTNAQGQFQCNVRVSNTRNPSRPTSDSGEGGLRAAYNFLSAPKITDPAINGGFMRDLAKLHVIMVSDEPDQSRGPTDLYVDFFRNLKGFRNESLVAVSAVAKRQGETCGQNDGAGDRRYEEVVNALNGRFQSICASDWSSTMRSLGLDSIGLQVEFFLSRAATDSTLQVCVRSGSSTANCAPATRTSSGAPNGWFYDATANSIVFNPGSVPPRGSRIEVRYETFCFQP